MKDEKTSRQERRRRRLRNQMLAYLTLIVLILLVLAAGYFGVKFIVSYVSNYNEKVNKVIEEAESSMAAEQENESYSELAPNGSTITEGYISPVDDNPLNTLIESLLSEMTIEEMVAGLFVVTPESITGVGTAVQAGEGTKSAITQNPVGGLIYAPKNFNTPQQFTEMLANTRSFAKYPIFTMVSAECGSKDYGLNATTKASELIDADSVKQAYGEIAATLASYGIDMDLAPVSEIVSEEGDSSLQGRTFGSDASAAAPLVSAAVQVIQEANVSAVLKKFPSATADTKSVEELKDSEFVIYDMAIQSGVDCIMVSHVKAKGITGDDTPSSLSSVVINDVLRNTLGFNGVIMTDRLDNSTITDNYSSGEAAVAAIQAGADILLSPENYQEAYEGILKAVADGTITQERIHNSIYRIYCVKYKNVIQS